MANDEINGFRTEPRFVLTLDELRAEVRRILGTGSTVGTAPEHMADVDPALRLALAPG